jgi:hypothetical protein
MLILNDLWVNFFEGEENGYNVPHFHEWRKDDPVELMDAIPLLKVSPELFDYIENDMASIPEELLEKVKNKAILRRGLETLKLPYAFVITDGNGILAVDTLSYKIPMRKGRLILRHEEIVLNKVKDRPVDFELPSDVVKEEKYYNVLSPHPNTMVGLTRKEKSLKQLLFMALDSVYNEENLSKIKYLYVEWNAANYADIDKWDLDGLFKQFVAEVSKGWSKQHLDLTKLITYDQPFYKKLYDIEMEGVK